VFQQIAIVGCGLIGGSVGLALRAAWPTCRIIAIDRSQVVDTALSRQAADTGGHDLGLASGADLIVLAAPVRQNMDVIRDLVKRVRGKAVVTDVGSTKRAMVEAAQHLPHRLRFIGGHPLAGAATGGIAAARPDLFRGRPWILTPTAPDRDAAEVEQLSALAVAVGAVPRIMDPIAHDRLMAYLSHLPQLAVSALMQVVGERVGREGLNLAGTGLRDTTRLASSPADTWRDVTATNVDAVGAAIDDLTVVLQRLRADLTVGQELQQVFDAAAAWKLQLDQSEGGDDSES
jgi:prephenate dehydrogenase